MVEKYISPDGEKEELYVKGKRPIRMPHPVKEDRYRFASLSKCTDLTVEQSKQIEDWLKSPRNFLYIHSTYGIGKTYMVSSIANRRYEKQQHTYMINESELFAKLQYQEHASMDAALYIKELCLNTFMIWDDFAATITNIKNGFDDALRKNILYQFVESRYNSELPTIIASNYSIDQLGSLVNPRVADRLAAKENVVIHLEGENKRQEGL